MLIEIERVNKYYNRGLANQVHALEDVFLKVAANEVICLQGPSGSGKSTLLSIIGCIISPTSGTASIMGRQLSRLPDHFLTRHRRENVGFIFQRFNLIEELSVMENITIPLLPLGITPKKRKEIAAPLLDKFALGHRKNFPVKNISGGEMQRTAIARALVLDPPILLADEPTAHLDHQLSSQFMNLMTTLKKEGKTVVITSHDERVAEHPIIDKKYQLSDGQLTNG